MSWEVDGETLTDRWEIEIPQKDSTLTDIAIKVDLSELPSVGFHDTVDSAGGDIRVTLSDSTTRLPLQIDAIDTGAETGIMWFKGTLSSSGVTKFYIFWGNGSSTQPAVDSTYGSENVWNSAVVGRWNFSDNVADSTSNDNDGSLNGTTSYVDGLYGRAINFDGSTGFVSVAHSAELDGMANLSVSFWMREETGVGIFQGAVAKMDTNNQNRSFVALIDTDEKPYCILYNSTPVRSSPDPKANSAFAVDTWTHIAYTYNGSTTTCYIDGVAQTTTGSLTGNIDSNNNTLEFARNRSSSDVYLEGDLQEPRIETASRSADWWVFNVLNQGDPSNSYTLTEAPEIPFVPTVIMF